MKQKLPFVTAYYGDSSGTGSINTATPMHEMFMNSRDVMVDENIDCDSDSSVAQVYRQRHISNKDQRFANIALDEAAKSTLLMQHGCIAVLSGKVIAKGCNNIRCHSKDGLLHYRKCCSAHAEICVLHKLCITELPPKIVQKIVLYIVRRSRSGGMVESAPCFHCTIRMKKLNIKAIVYSNSDGELEKRKMNEYDSDKLTYGAKRVIEPTFYIR
jgi:tRNA(Arg) A34 adenosine deaminase TadA